MEIVGAWEISEYVGHLAAELQDARHLYDHNKISKEQFLRKIELVRTLRLRALKQRAPIQRKLPAVAISWSAVAESVAGPAPEPARTMEPHEAVIA